MWDLIELVTGGIPTADEIKGRLEDAKDTYRDQKAEINRLTEENEQLRAQIKAEDQ